MEIIGKGWAQILAGFFIKSEEVCGSLVASTLTSALKLNVLNVSQTLNSHNLESTIVIDFDECSQSACWLEFSSTQSLDNNSPSYCQVLLSLLS